LALDVGAAERAIAERIAAPLGFAGADGLIRMAEGIVSIATIVMAGAIRRISVEHGRDPRDFVLFAYGGGGPLHAAALARELHIPTIVIPPEPGNFSAIGMLLADARLDDSKTFVGLLGEGSVAAIAEVFAAMERGARDALAREFDARDVVCEHHAEMRYRGQRHNIKVPISGLADAAAIRQAFERDYRRRYGHADAKAPAEFQALHLSAFARLRRPAISALPRARKDPGPARRRPVHFAGTGGAIAAQIFDRDALPPGFTGAGPAVIEEYGSTTLVWPGDKFAIGTLGEIRIDCAVA
jgi:N-methylhydantoinase A